MGATFELWHITVTGHNRGSITVTSHNRGSKTVTGHNRGSNTINVKNMHPHRDSKPGPWNTTEGP